MTRKLTLTTRMSIALATLLAVNANCNFNRPSYIVEGRSMEPAFYDDDRVLTERLPGFEQRIEHGTVVIFKQDGETLIKRVMYLPGDHVPSIHFSYNPQEHGEGCYLGPDEYWVLGDYRTVSVDSRIFGPVKRENIFARVTNRTYSSITDKTHARIARD